jgi:CheY-like chemotaxis protein
MTVRRILIVDDHTEVRRMLRAGLETLGPNLQVIDVPSGEEAMLVVSRQMVDVMVVDVRLPGMSGLELLGRARLSNPDPKLILITGVTDPHIRQQVAQAGAQAFFFKPIEMPAFLEAVQRCLEAGPSGPPPLPAPSPPSVPARSLPEVLEDLRGTLRAALVLFFDDHTKVLGRSGNLPRGATEPELVLALQAAFSAGRNAISLLGKDLAEDLVYIAGAGYDLFLAPVGPAKSLALVVPNSPAGPRPESVLHALVPAVEELLTLLPELETQVPPPASGSLGTGGLRRLDAIFSQPQKTLRADDLDAFWDSAAEQGAGQGAMSADHLSFDEAQKRGLTPE